MCGHRWHRTGLPGTRCDRRPPPQDHPKRLTSPASGSRPSPYETPEKCGASRGRQRSAGCTAAATAVRRGATGETGPRSGLRASRGLPPRASGRGGAYATPDMEALAVCGAASAPPACLGGICLTKRSLARGRAHRRLPGPAGDAGAGRGKPCRFRRCCHCQCTALSPVVARRGRLRSCTKPRYTRQKVTKGDQHGFSEC